jgi:hypothetical protein
VSNTADERPIQRTTDFLLLTPRTLFCRILHIDETPDAGNISQCAYPSTKPCADAITPQKGPWSANQVFEVNHIQYSILLQGFRESQDPSSPLTTTFISNENATNSGTGID